MIKAELLFTEIGQKIKEAEQGQLFGKPCFKINGKAFICFFQNCMVFKLTDIQHQEALSLDGSVLFDPSGKNRPMKEWVQVQFDQSKKWEKFSKAAFEYVKNNS